MVDILVFWIHQTFTRLEPMKQTEIDEILRASKDVLENSTQHTFIAIDLARAVMRLVGDRDKMIQDHQLWMAAGMKAGFCFCQGREGNIVEHDPEMAAAIMEADAV